MKHISYLIVFVFFFAFAQEGFAQRTRTRTTNADAGNSGLPELTTRAKIKNEEDSKDPGQVAWLREIYRYIDLEKEMNAPLYYPTVPIGNRMNLFTIIFRLLAENKVSAYNYLDGREIFTEAEKLNFKEFLEKFEVLHTMQGEGVNAKYTVDDSDIPSAEVLKYMVKEAYYFDAATGTYKSQVLALCPLLVREDFYYGGTTSDALFWVKYEDIRPYISRELIMTSNYNNALTYTIDDYFSKNMYQGEIVKTTNLMNLSLQEQVAQEQAKRDAARQAAAPVDDLLLDDEMASADEVIDYSSEIIETDIIPVQLVDTVDYLKLAQDSIEHQLKKFEEDLWVYNDSIAKKLAEPQAKGKKTKAAKKEKSSKKEKGSSGSSAPVRSVRRGR